MADVQTAPRLGEFGILIGGETVRTGVTFEVRSPYDGAHVGTVHYAGPADIERAITVKQSGFGREGLRYAIEEMTEMKLVAYNRR
jgi:acyl-CoA reductase-like NAD-dependent aldehyde dehydrogenase